MWVEVRQNRQNMYYFVINLPLRGHPLKRFLQNVARERESQVCTLTLSITIVAFKMWAYRPQNRQNQKMRGNAHKRIILATKMFFFLGGAQPVHHTPLTPTAPRPLLTEILNTPLRMNVPALIGLGLEG